MQITFFHNKKRWSWVSRYPCTIPAEIFVEPNQDVGEAIDNYLKGLT